jgi:hypothetical protein
MKSLSSRARAPALLGLLRSAMPAHAATVKSMNIVDLIDHAETILAGRVESVADGVTVSSMPYTEVTVRVIDRFRGAQGEHYGFRQFGLSAPHTMPNGRGYLRGRPDGWPIWIVGELSLLFLHQKARVTGFQTTVGLGYGKLGMANGVAVNAYDNVGLFANIGIDRTKLSADELKMIDAKNGPVDADTLCNFVRRAIDQKLTPETAPLRFAKQLSAAV